MQSRTDRRRNPHARDRTVVSLRASRVWHRAGRGGTVSLGLRCGLFSGLLAEVVDEVVDRVDVVSLRSRGDFVLDAESSHAAG